MRFYGDRPPGVEGDILPGRLLVIEGTDGVGRSTQIALLKEWLEDRGYPVLTTGLTRSELAGRGIKRAKRGNTLDPLTLNLFYAADFWDRLERQIIPALRAGMVALADRYIFTLMARAAVRGVSRAWMDDLYGFALIPDRVLYLDTDVEHLVPRTLGSKGFDYWESGQDFLRGPDLFHNFVQYQTLLLAEFRRLALRYGFTPVDGRRSVAGVFAAVRAEVEAVLSGMADEAPRRSSPLDPGGLGVQGPQALRREQPAQHG
ncbi:MAG: thymidylate kinase [Chloroflexi bacterium]|nr:thymidylate kinase [Chloroflexota bacterium]